MWSKHFKPWIRRAAELNTDWNNCKRDQGKSYLNYFIARHNISRPTLQPVSIKLSIIVNSTLDQIYTTADSNQTTVLVSNQALPQTPLTTIYSCLLCLDFRWVPVSIDWISSHLTSQVQHAVTGLSQSENKSTKFIRFQSSAFIDIGYSHRQLITL